MLTKTPGAHDTPSCAANKQRRRFPPKHLENVHFLRPSMCRPRRRHLGCHTVERVKARLRAFQNRSISGVSHVPRVVGINDRSSRRRDTSIHPLQHPPRPVVPFNQHDRRVNFLMTVRTQIPENDSRGPRLRRAEE